jgi:AcrR family transcriptional regulator
VPERSPSPSARQAELLEAAYGYVLAHGMSGLSLRPLAAAIGSSPRVLLYLFGSKDGLVQALLARAREAELAMLAELAREQPGLDLPGAAGQVWGWLSDPRHRDLLALWVEGYARSLTEPAGPWAAFGRQAVADWLEVLAGYQPEAWRRTEAAARQRTAALALLRGALLDLLATGDGERVTAAVQDQLPRLSQATATR